MVGYVSQRAEIFWHPHEVNRQLGWRKFLVGDERLQSTSSFHHGAGAGGVVIGAPLGMVKMSADKNFALRVFRASNVSMNQCQFAWAKRSVNFAMHADRALMHQRFQHVILIARNLKAAGSFVKLFCARPDAVI